MKPLPPMMPSSPDIPLHDIKPLVEVPDHSLLLLSGLLVLAVVLIGSGIYLAWRHLLQRKKVNIRLQSYKALKSITFEDSKKAAYAITRHGLLFSKEGGRYKEAYLELNRRLAPYKYKKEVASIDEETLAYFQIYVEMIDA